ncbi:hypothetical protein L210DRAFT_3505625 [Boletus edulis BED1]|uniref:Uncharacterized protein n=1 Tax=Boletus edulis BED1 TaxID=1328754 RepID=A0AAD4GCW5_BOLED|nr:hypothetical protein L210DRAFT_3505625 [Boletus edulis BED1]
MLTTISGHVSFTHFLLLYLKTILPGKQMFDQSGQEYSIPNGVELSGGPVRSLDHIAFQGDVKGPDCILAKLTVVRHVEVVVMVFGVKMWPRACFCLFLFVATPDLDTFVFIPLHLGTLAPYEAYKAVYNVIYTYNSGTLHILFALETCEWEAADMDVYVP